MGELAIEADGVGKQYRIGAAGPAYETLRERITDFATAPLRLLRGRAARQAFVEFWALRGVSFDVKRGEVVGIIGRNGAGKSTLLKILSRITEPTEGRVTLRGRVGSLLEVGTGFHPELTGRENVYLNGAILGMRRAEVRRKFDEIVAFSEVEKFLDTPVKFYSSGMYMRLAFAVAAHLEPDILIVDEVLAVGDAEFQRKCLGKMGEVSRQGRTVLFVSHNIQAISQLTQRVVVLNKGAVIYNGATAEGVVAYLSGANQAATTEYRRELPASDSCLLSARVLCSGSENIHRGTEPIEFRFVLKVVGSLPGLCFSFQVVNEMQQAVCHFWMFDQEAPFRCGEGEYELVCRVPRFRLYMGTYSLVTWLTDRRSSDCLETLSHVCPFEVSFAQLARPEYDWNPRDMAYLEDAEWSARAV